MSAKSLSQDMCIDELERNMSEAARQMLDNGHHEAMSPQLLDWLKKVAGQTSYSRLQRKHIQVF